MINYHFDREENIPSPALVYYKDLIETNTKKAIAIAGSPERLWPHVKTHKIAEMIEMQVTMGIRRFKCATVSEIRTVAGAGGEHIIWAYPLVGPNIGIFLSLMEEFPRVTLYAIEDDLSSLEALNSAAAKRGLTAHVLLDINMGMNRTGMAPKRIGEFYEAAAKLKNIELRGLHCYDGHIHDEDFGERLSHASPAAEKVYGIRRKLQARGYDLSVMVMGGTPTFPCHARAEDVFLSPGTLFVSDDGYRRSFPDIDVIPAAAVLTRVISRPGDDLFTLDTGYKAISSDADPRGVLVGFEGKAEPVLSSEEHWVFRMKPEFLSDMPKVGDIIYAIPTHICPTTAMYDGVYVVEEGKLAGIWKVAARERIGGISPEELL